MRSGAWSSRVEAQGSFSPYFRRFGGVQKLGRGGDRHAWAILRGRFRRRVQFRRVCGVSCLKKCIKSTLFHHAGALVTAHRFADTASANRNAQDVTSVR
jgi:hypothetical protein